MQAPNSYNPPLRVGEEVGLHEKVNILLVDDREDNLLTMGAVLASPEYNLVTAQSGQDALRYLLNDVPALILLDVQMPGLDGYETARLIKGSPRTREVPIIFVTALNKDERFVQQGYKSGAVDYIYKPFDAEILRSKVAVFADLHRKTERLLRVERLLRESEARERERKLAELELRSLRREQADQKRYRELVEGIHHGIVWTADPENLRFSFVSSRAEQILGYPVDAWLNSTSFLQDRLHPDDRELFRHSLRKVVAEGLEAMVEHRLRDAAGRFVWFQTGLRPVTIKDEPQVQGLSVDISRLKETEGKLKQSKLCSDLLAHASLVLSTSLAYEDTLPALAELVADTYGDWCAIEVIDTSGRLNPSALKTRERSRDLDVLELLRAHPLEDAEVERYRSEENEPRMINAPTEDQLRAVAGNPDRAQALGELGCQSLAVIPLCVRGKYYGRILLGRRGRAFEPRDFSLLRDLGRRAAVSLENSSLYRETEAAVRARDEFLSIASHELRTPLTPLKLHIQQLIRTLTREAKAGTGQERILKMVDVSNRQIERLTKLIDDLLDISRINSGKLKLNLEDFDLMACLHEVTSRFSEQLEIAGCALELRGPDKLPVHWDQFRTEQVILNLLTNAVRYAPGKPVIIEVSAHQGMVELTVLDHGIGIAKEDQARIFRRFERAVSSNHFGGLGLGLYIVAQILDAQGGGISVDSNPGEGSKFIVSLPQFVNAGSQPDSAA
jgi:PAS domain S-box-containing protein